MLHTKIDNNLTVSYIKIVKLMVKILFYFLNKTIFGLMIKVMYERLLIINSLQIF